VLLPLKTPLNIAFTLLLLPPQERLLLDFGMQLQVLIPPTTSAHLMVNLFLDGTNMKLPLELISPLETLLTLNLETPLDYTTGERKYLGENEMMNSLCFTIDITYLYLSLVTLYLETLPLLEIPFPRLISLSAQLPNTPSLATEEATQIVLLKHLF
jgi:hypothetical protein